MDGYKLNKFAGAVILAVLVIMGIKEINGLMNSAEEETTTAYQIEGAEQDVAATEPDAPSSDDA